MHRITLANMSVLEQALQMELNLWSITLRLITSFLLGGIIGMERELDKQPAGFRTHILICIGATLLMVLSIHVPQTFAEYGVGDPGRIAAQVVSGIGFLGAGAIVRLGVNIKGLTTAASIWLVAGLGLAIGAGLYIASSIATVLILVALVILKKLEKRLIKEQETHLLEVFFKGDHPNAKSVQEIITNYASKIYSMNINQAVEKNSIKLQFYLQIPEDCDYDSFFKELRKLKNLKRLKLE